MRWAAAALLLPIGVALNGSAQDAPLDLQKYQLALQTARERNDVATEAAMLFNIGRLAQGRSEGNCAPPECAQLKAQAIEAYEGVMRISPMSAGTMNNLALLYAESGKTAEARKWFERLMGIDTANSGLYALNYARFLVGTAGLNEAKGYFEFAMKDPAVGGDAARAYGNALMEADDHRGFLNFAWGNFRARPPLVEELALDVIAANRWSSDEQLELLNIVVASLVNQEYAPGDFFNSRLASKLADLATHPTLGQGVREILAIHRVPVPDVSQLTWWANVRLIRSGGQILAPHQAYRALILHIGDQYARVGERDLATNLYYVAAFLNAGRPDPVAFFKLVSSYYASGMTPDRFAKAVDEYEPILYSLSSRFDGDDWCAMLEFHRQVGILYGLVANRAKRGEAREAWGRAVDELAKARRLIDACTKVTDGELDPYSIEVMAQGYAATDRLSLANQVRLDAAEVYLKRNRRDYAASVVEHVSVATLPPADQIRFQLVVTALARQQ